MCSAGGAAEEAASLVNRLEDLMQKNALGTRKYPQNVLTQTKSQTFTHAKTHRLSHTHTHTHTDTHTLLKKETRLK